MFEKKDKTDELLKLMGNLAHIPTTALDGSLYGFYERFKNLSWRIDRLKDTKEIAERSAVELQKISKEISEFRSKMNEINVKTETSVQELNDKISSIQIPDVTELINQVNTIIAKQTELEKKIDLTPFGNRLDEIEKEINDLKMSFNALVSVQDEELRQKLASSKGKEWKKALDRHQRTKKIEKQKLMGKAVEDEDDKWREVPVSKFSVVR